MKKLDCFFMCTILIISFFVLTACNQNIVISEEKKDSIQSMGMIDISDDELVDIAMNISKKENNYTYWLFSFDDVDDSDIIKKEVIFTHNGEDFLSLYDYALVTKFNSIEDFVNKASKCLSTEYIENYLYKLVGLHPTENIPAPILLEQNGKLYKRRDVDGISIIPNISYFGGEVIERTVSSAIIRMYVDPSVDTDIAFIDYPLLLEDDVWKYNPKY